jgi:hypothetical protein
MVQAAESWQGLNLPSSSRRDGDGPADGRVLCQSEMNPVLVVVEHVLRDQPFEMPLIQDGQLPGLFFAGHYRETALLWLLLTWLPFFVALTLSLWTARASAETKMLR